MKKYEVRIEHQDGTGYTIITKRQEKALRIQAEAVEVGDKAYLTEFDVDTRDFAQMVMENC